MNEYALTVARGPTSGPHDHGAVAVIDGRTIKLTPFRTANVPPPMAMCELEVESPVVDAAFAADCSSMAVLHQAGVTFFALESKGPRLSAPRLVSTAPFEKTRSQFYEESLLQVGFSGPAEVHVLQMADDLEFLRHDFGAPQQEPKTWLKNAGASSLSTIGSPGSVSIEGVVAQDRSGRLSRISAGESSPLPVRFPSFLPWVSLVTHDGEVLAFGLSKNGALYANSRQLAKNCTSFLVTENHLIFTTNNHFVKFVHLAAAEGRSDILKPANCSAGPDHGRSRCPAR